MGSRRKLRSVVVAGALGFVLIAAGCSASNDPATWEEAEADGNLRANFLRACTEAGSENGDLDDSQAASYCECAFRELVEYFGGEIVDGELRSVAEATGNRDFEAFKSQEGDLRDDPEAVPADIRAMFTGCFDQVS